MAPRRSFDEAGILDVAMEVFCRHGYEGASMGILTRAMNLRAPSIYAAFGSKQGLFEAVLDRCARQQNELMQPVLAASSAHEVARLFLTTHARFLLGKGGMVYRFLVVAGVVAGPDNAAIPASIAHQRGAMERALVNRFDLARITGDLPSDASPKSLAELLFTLLYGLVLRTHDRANQQDVDHVVALAMRSWPHLPPDAKAAPPNDSNAETNGVPRGRRKAFSPPDALTAAMHVFWRKGYEGASLNDLTAAMGINRPSLYATFGSKEALFLAALKRYRDENMAYGRDALDAPVSRSVVERMLDGAVSTQTSDRHPRGCLWIVNSMQGGDDAQIIRQAVLDCIAEAHVLFTARLELAKRDGDLPETADPEGLARLIGSVLHGIAMLGAAGAPPAKLRKLADDALSTWPT